MEAFLWMLFGLGVLFPFFPRAVCKSKQFDHFSALLNCTNLEHIWTMNYHGLCCNPGKQLQRLIKKDSLANSCLFSKVNSQGAGTAAWRVVGLCSQVPEKPPFINCGCHSVCFKCCSAPALSWCGGCARAWLCGTTDVTRIPLNLGWGPYLGADK